MQLHLAFAAFVAVGVYVQTVTGFALGLVLLGLIGITNLVPLPDAANAVTVMIVVNSAVFLFRRWPFRLEPAIWPAVAVSLVGSLVGMWLMTFLATNSYGLLRTVLGVCVMGCALLLWRAPKPLSHPSGNGAFVSAGILSGLLGGAFSAPGPPLVYVAYRQPWPHERIQEALLFSFGVGAVLRLFVMGATRNFSHQALLLSAEALPVTFAVTALCANRPPPLPRERLKHVVCALLILAGAGMAV